MEDEVDAYNSDSGENDFPMDDVTDEGNGADDKDTVHNWINWFCTLDGHEYMVDIDPEFIIDPHNLHCFDSVSKDRFKKCLQMILGDKAPTEEELADE